MTFAKYEALNLDELRHYVLTHRDDLAAFYVYVDRAKATGQMITISPDNPNWAAILRHRIQQSSNDERSLFFEGVPQQVSKLAVIETAYIFVNPYNVYRSVQFRDVTIQSK